MYSYVGPTVIELAYLTDSQPTRNLVPTNVLFTNSNAIVSECIENG